MDERSYCHLRRDHTTLFFHNGEYCHQLTQGKSVLSTFQKDGESKEAIGYWGNDKDFEISDMEWRAGDPDMLSNDLSSILQL